MWWLKDLLAARAGWWFLESSSGVNIQEIHQVVGRPGKASSTLLLKRSLALTFHLSWATGKVSISFSVGD